MINKKITSSEIRQTFIDYFVKQRHTFVPSASLVPGGDATLLFTNAGMVQFKGVFIGTDNRPYKRAVNSQKCMRVAGKHNDFEDVGRDNTHNTFFEMLGNWSFGDYYKEEAIKWAWQLLTEVWSIPKDNLYATYFKDDKGNIPTDEEAAAIWRSQPGMDSTHVLHSGRKDNLWEMAETGPCGPCSEIHIDCGEEFDDLAGIPHKCGVNGDCNRYLELWNLVFIQYNRLDATRLEPLPFTHVDTGLGLERIVSVLQGVDSNYKTDLFMPMIEIIRNLSGQSLEQVYADFTSYRVIADHTRAAAFLIADGVVPGNTGRNYVSRMIIRRAARFATKIGLNEPFLAKVVEPVIEDYGVFYPELIKHKQSIFDSLTREEIRFARTIESGTAFLQVMLDEVKKDGKTFLDGRKAFDLYATYGLPLEISRDIAREQSLEVDEIEFRNAREDHSLASGGGKAMGDMGGSDTEFFAGIFKDLQSKGKLNDKGVEYDPYNNLQVNIEVLAIVVNGQSVTEVQFGDKVEVILPKTGFYIESGGQVSDTGVIRSTNWEIEVTDLRRPAVGIITHIGEVVSGKPRVDDNAIAEIDMANRHNIMRNHTATHLLQTSLRKVLGEHARQAGSFVASDRLRFDFNHSDAITTKQIERIEKIVNDAIADDYIVTSSTKSRQEAVAEGAMALFGEKYGDVVRTICIGAPNHYSYELCGGTHLSHTSGVCAFIITKESSAAAGIRRIEAVTGHEAYKLITKRFKALKNVATMLKSIMDEVPAKVGLLQDDISAAKKQIATLRAKIALSSLNEQLTKTQMVNGVNLLILELPELDKDSLTKLADTFRGKFPNNGVCIIASIDADIVIVMVAITQDLIKQGIKAGDLVGYISRQLGAGGGGAPHLAFGGGKNTAKLSEALESVTGWLIEKTK